MFVLGVLEKGCLIGDEKPGGAAGIWTLALHLTWSLSGPYRRKALQHPGELAR